MTDLEERALAAEAQLAACRLLLGVTMRERDELGRLCDAAHAELARLRKFRMAERENVRTWLNRCVRVDKVWN